MKRLLLALLAVLALPTAVDASTYNLICTPLRTHQITYIDKTSDSGVTRKRSKYKEDIKSRKKFKVSYNLKNNNGFIENNSAKAVRILDAEPDAYAPLFLYSQVVEVDRSDIEENEYGAIHFLSLKVNTWNIRIDRPTNKLTTSFFSIKSLQDSELRETFKNSGEFTGEGILTEKLIHEISTGGCDPIK